MKNKFITIILSIILFVVPIAIVPNALAPCNLAKVIPLLICGFILLISTTITIGELHFDKVDILISIFGGLAILSTIFSKNIFMSFSGASNRFEGIFTILTYILIYYNSKYYFKNYRGFTTILSVLYILICAFAIVQFYINPNFYLVPIFQRGAAGTFGNTNFMGSFVSIILPAFILGSIFKNRKIYYIGSAFGFSAMLLCLARSSWVAFVISMILITLCLILKKNKKYFKRFFIIIILFILCFSALDLLDKKDRFIQKIDVAQQEISTAFQSGLSDKMGSGRIAIWKLTGKLILKVPIFGCGVDALEVGLAKILPEENAAFIARANVYIDKAHNEYLQIAATMGIPALIVYLVFISMIIFPSIKNIKKSKVITSYTIVIISYLVQAFFNISTIGIAPIFWFILGLASRNINYKTIKNSTSN